MNKKIFLIFSLFLLLVSCKKDAQNAVEQIGEHVMYSDSSITIYAYDKIWSGIVLSTTNPEDLVKGIDYHIPSWDEAVILHNVKYQANTSERFICYNQDSVYYTFQFSSMGNITKAGGKTKYSLMGVRTLRPIKDTIIKL